ncbi:EndoU domain-containing protein [Desulfogranum japonicum]|uniref:EndoU domain-containing protein n=1 Tax=Desulfogranum japonicum TaxID=231447 RepID=UPI00040ED980|nr:EndoU domain-containing protein [Desulfogranum japonicum]
MRRQDSGSAKDITSLRFFLQIHVISLLFAFLLFFPGSAEAGKKSQWSNTTPQINLTHIFQGEINRQGKATGFHSRPGGIDTKNAKVLRILAGPNSRGVYTAQAALLNREGKWLTKFSSFFPDSMDKKDIITAILHAWQHRQTDQSQPWQGPSGRGFLIQGYINKQGNINTAFPLYTKP